MYRTCTTEPYSVLVNYNILPSDDQWRFKNFYWRNYKK